MKTPLSRISLPIILLILLAPGAFSRENSPPEDAPAPEIGTEPPAPPEAPPATVTPLRPAPDPGQPVMDSARLDALIKELDPDAQREPGFWEFQVEGIPVICVADENANRMRIITPVASLQDLEGEHISNCMEANFDRALDARYCVNKGLLWSAFIHPLGDLTPALFHSAVAQVLNLKITFGTTYNGGELFFNQQTPETKEPEGKKEPGESKDPPVRLGPDVA